MSSVAHAPVDGYGAARHEPAALRWVERARELSLQDDPAAHPLQFHFAVVAKDARAERARLEKAGAKLFVEDTLPDGSLLIMMRDPWGVALQLCQRAKPFPGY